MRVGGEVAGLGASSSPKKSHSAKNNVSLLLTDKYSKKSLPVEAVGPDDFAPPSLPFTGGSSANDIEQWQFDEFLGLTDVNQNYNYIDNVSSKVIHQFFFSVHLMYI